VCLIAVIQSLFLLGIGVISSVIGDAPSFTKTIYVDGDNTEGHCDGTKERPHP